MSELPDLGTGDLIYVDEHASVQFKAYPFVARIIMLLPSLTAWDGWQWVRVYQLGTSGWAVAERDVYVRTAGVLRVKTGKRGAPNVAAGRAGGRSGRNERRPRPAGRGGRTSTPDVRAPSRT